MKLSSSLKRLPCIILVYIFIFLPELGAYKMDELERDHIRGDLNTPCFYFNTVNVTDDPRFPNGSYLHQGVMIPHKYIGVYNYAYKDPVTPYKVAPHVRGCICELKNCINFCCPYGKLFNGTISGLECVDAMENFEWPRTINVTLKNGTVKTTDVFDQYAIVDFRPCEQMYALDPMAISEDMWQVFENGTVHIPATNTYMTRLDYCVVPSQSENDTSGTFYLNPANCALPEISKTVKIINAYAMLFSVPFMVLTIAVYLIIPELRNQHGKSLVCYLLGLSMGYCLLGATILDTQMDVYGFECRFLGYGSYYCFMAAFFWLSVISFDLWHNFRGTRGINRIKERKCFIMYSLYSWGIPIILLLATWYIQEYVDLPSQWKPGIGGGLYCFIDMSSGWGGLIYFIGPMLLITLANIVMFIMTALKIHKVQKEMARIMAKEDSTRNLKNEKDKFGLFLRLFLVMGVSWSVEVISYFVGESNKWSKLFYFGDICNAIQGFIIFMLFVMKQKVKQLIINRFSSVREATSQQRQSQYSTRTTSSSMGNLAHNNLTSLPSEKPLMRPYERITSFS